MKEFEFKKVTSWNLKIIVLLLVVSFLFWFLVYFSLFGLRFGYLVFIIALGLFSLTMMSFARYFATDITVRISESDFYIKTKNKDYTFNKNEIESIFMPDYSQMRETLFSLKIKLSNGKTIFFQDQDIANKDKYDEEKKVKLYGFSKSLLNELHFAKTNYTKTELSTSFDKYNQNEFIKQPINSMENEKPYGLQKPNEFKEFFFKSVITLNFFQILMISLFGGLFWCFIYSSIMGTDFRLSWACMSFLLYFALMIIIFKLFSKDIVLKVNKDFIIIEENNCEKYKFLTDDLTGFYSPNYLQTNEYIDDGKCNISIIMFFKNKKISITESEPFRKYSKGKTQLLKRFLLTMQECTGVKEIRKNKLRSFFKQGAVWYGKIENKI